MRSKGLFRVINFKANLWEELHNVYERQWKVVSWLENFLNPRIEILVQDDDGIGVYSMVSTSVRLESSLIV